MEQVKCLYFVHKGSRKQKVVKRVKYTHNLLCECRRCDPGIIAKWRKISVKDLA